MMRTACARSRIAVILAIVLNVSIFSAGGLRAQTPEAAAERLKRIEVYAFGGIGFASVTSQGELEYRAIMGKPFAQALPLLEDVFAHGNSQAKSYALKGIHQLDAARFNQLLESVAASDDDVLTMSGCVRSARRLKDVAQGISKSTTDLSSYRR